MTVESQGNKKSWIGDGSTTVYAYPYPFQKTEDIEIYFDGIKQTTGYSIQTLPDYSGGANITFLEAPADGIEIIIRRNIGVTQEVSYPENGEFPAKSHEKALDKLTLIILDKLSETIKINPSTLETVNLYLPKLVARKGLRVNDDGTGFALTDDDINSILTDPGFIEVSQDLLLGENSKIRIDANNKNNIITVANDLTESNNIGTVANSISNVNTVGTNINNINSVADNETNINTVATDLLDDNDIGTVANSISNVNATGSSINNVNTVATDLLGDNNIETVANSISNVNAVGANISNVIAVDDNKTNINAVNANKTNIDNVSNNISDVQDVGASITDVIFVANDLYAINAVNANKTNIDTLASDISSVRTVGQDITKVISVANNLTAINAVNANKTNIDTVSSNIDNISNVATNSANITKVANNETNISAVANNGINISTVAANMSDIVEVANDLDNIDNASTYATNANIWAEGTDEQVQALGGIHSAKEWAKLQGLSFKGEYSVTSTYNKNYYVSKAEALTTSFYLSITDNNVGNPLTDTTNWLPLWTITSGGSVAFQNVTGDPYSNPNLATILNLKYGTDNPSNYQTDTQVSSAISNHNTSNTAHNDIRQDISSNTTAISSIDGKIPSQATTTNQLADKAFVNSSVQTATSNFRGNWNTWADVPTDPTLYPVDHTGVTTPSVNDYMVVQADETRDGGTWRYKYSGIWATDGKNGWNAEYEVNETPLTAAQLASLNSGATTTNIGQITTNTINISANTNSIATLQTSKYDASNPSGYQTSTQVDTAISTHNSSGSAHSSLFSAKQDIAQPRTTLSTSGTIALSDNSIYYIAPTGTVTFTLPSVSDNTKFHQILVQINMATAVTIDVGTTYFFDKTAPDLSAAGLYNLIYEYDGSNWVVGLLSKGAAS